MLQLEKGRVQKLWVQTMSIESSVSRQKANTSLVNEFDCGGVINKVPKYRWNLVCDVFVLYYAASYFTCSPSYMYLIVTVLYLL